MVDYTEGAGIQYHVGLERGRCGKVCDSSWRSKTMSEDRAIF